MTNAPACIPNIGPRGISRRRRNGWIALVAGLAIAALLITFDAPRWTRIALLVPFWSAGLGFFQARERT